ncbi:hypothetical protein LJC33_02545 [Eubacteriales bacterium OttesenSCG-928-N13]|nr:hypothetical protein [Eubacteriales bacterium OttesenSCG-928-N13]
MNDIVPDSSLGGEAANILEHQMDYDKTQASHCLLSELAKGEESLRLHGGLSIDEAFFGLEG